MNTLVALLRGVNVGGTNKVPMAELRKLATGLGWGQVKTYIASGNLVFDADASPKILAQQLQNALSDEMGVSVPILVLPARSIQDVVAACPFNDVGNLIHLLICETSPTPDDAKVSALIAPDEQVVIQDQFVWFYAPSGVGRSKLFAQLEKVMGVQGTARNLNTMIKLAKMVDDR